MEFYRDTNPSENSMSCSGNFKLPKKLIDHKCPECETDEYLADIKSTDLEMDFVAKYSNEGGATAFRFSYT